MFPRLTLKLKASTVACIASLAMVACFAPAAAATSYGAELGTHPQVTHFLSKTRIVSTGHTSHWYGNVFSRGSIEIDGATYPTSLRQAGYDCCETYSAGQSAWMEWNLAKKCTNLYAAEGISDNSPDDNTQATWKVFGDGKPLKSWTIGFGAVRKIGVDVTNVLRLKLEVTIVTAGVATYGWGNARVVCSS
jgi:hypothetical protein